MSGGFVAPDTDTDPENDTDPGETKWRTPDGRFQILGLVVEHLFL